MYKRKVKKNNKSYLLILLAILIFIISIFFVDFIKNKSSNITSYLNYPIIYLKDKIYAISNSKKIQKENKYLMLANKELMILKDKNTELEKELEVLKNQLNLKNIFTNYRLINATIISRNKEYWFNEIIIDRGKKDNIELNMAVVTNKGLIGKIIKVYDSTSVVKMITNNDSNNRISVSVTNDNKEYHGIITEYNKDNNLLKVTGLTSYEDIKIDSNVVTTGYGVFPKGISIGKVVKIEKDKYNIEKILYVETYQDMNKIKYVSVLGNKIND